MSIDFDVKIIQFTLLINFFELHPYTYTSSVIFLFAYLCCINYRKLRFSIQFYQDFYLHYLNTNKHK